MILIKKKYIYILIYFQLKKKLYITHQTYHLLTSPATNPRRAWYNISTYIDALIATRYSDLKLIHCEESKIFTFGSSDAIVTIKKKKQI